MDYCPKEVLADKIYCTRANRKWLAEKTIMLSAQPLGRPGVGVGALSNPVRPGDRNRIEGKLAYGLDSIKVKLKATSESWIACIALVLNLLVNLTRQALLSRCRWIVGDIFLQKNTSKNLFFLKST